MKKYAMIAGLISLVFIITGCNTTVVGSNLEVDSGFKAEHLHGLGYANDNNIYIATHAGLLSSDESGSEWALKGGYNFDFMGYYLMSDGTMVTSGHPSKGATLPDPLGVMTSIDNGGKWESQSMLGLIDYHIITSNFSNPNVLYGINQMDTGKYKAGIYKSTDKGKNWDIIESQGLPEDLHQVYSLISLPNDENTLIAGTEIGVIRSNDGGVTWKLADPSRLITAITVLPDTKELISYTLTNKEAGLAISKDNGESWEYIGLNLGRDAASYLGVNPNDTSKMVVATFENNVYITTDYGENWNTLLDKGIVQ